jgi:hypothetical protein
VRTHILWNLGLALFMAQPVLAATFVRSPMAPELGVETLTRRTAQSHVNRDLFANPYATVTISNVDVYDRFPYLETREFQVVSDPRWNRLVYGERGRSLKAYDGKSGPLGALKEPRGMAVDEAGRVYVADAGNHRIVVLQAHTEFGAIDLVPVEAIGGLSRPYDVAYSDGGTPFQSGDDHLYVADAGKNRVVAFALRADGPRLEAAIGELGSGTGRFAGPLAVAVGRTASGSTRDVYVADSHNRRIAHLRHEPSGLVWVAEARHQADVLTALDTDAWGNVYAVAPRQGSVQKFSAALEPVAELRQGLVHPRGIHVPFTNLRDHRDGSLSRVGQPSAITVDEWSPASGIGMWRLGLDLSGLSVVETGEAAARFTLTDRARVTLEIRDAASGRSLARRTTEALGAGSHSLPLSAEDLRNAAAAGEPVLRLTAASTYPNGPSVSAEARLRPSGGVVLPTAPMLLGSTPNPAAPTTRITFLLPVASGRVSLRAFDSQGRKVRTFDRDFAPGLNEVVWDGTDDRGRHVQGGVYFYRLEVGETRFTGTVALVR